MQRKFNLLLFAQVVATQGNSCQHSDQTVLLLMTVDLIALHQALNLTWTPEEGCRNQLRAG